MGWIDLHIHSTYSDGTLSPAALVDLAKKIGLQAVALTDHDTMAGVAEALARGRQVDVKVIAGIEISAWHENMPLHILGYGLRFDTLSGRKNQRRDVTSRSSGWWNPRWRSTT